MSESYNVREEIEVALKKDKTRLGDVFNQRDRPPEEIASTLGVATKGFVYSHRQYIDAIQEGKIPTATTLASQTGSAVRGFLKRHEELSEKARIALERIAEECDRQAQNKVLADKEEIENKKQSEELLKRPGIYVYSYPHYLKHPHILSQDGVTDERKMMKIGMSGVDARTRVFGQTAAMPEEPVTLYLFTGVGEVRFSTCSDDELLGVEKKIHKHLENIGHRRSSDTGGGKEWFITNEKTIESIANLLDLRTDDEDNPGDET